MSEFITIRFNKAPKVSVIVVTKNEEKNIANCLQSIRNQSYGQIELIVVDNFSKDKTVELAQKYDATIYLKGNERSAQRNYGVQNASGKYILYLDADMSISPHLIEECVKKCESNHAHALYIPERIIGYGFWIKVRDFERNFYTGTVVDAVRFVRKDFFVKVNGFDESLVGPEDWDFDRKIRKICRTDIVSEPLYHNEGRFSLKNYMKKKSYYTGGIQRYAAKWGPKDNETAKQLGMSYRLIGVFFEGRKYRQLIKHPFLTIGLYTLRISVALEYFIVTKLNLD